MMSDLSSLLVECAVFGILIAALLLYRSKFKNHK